MPAKQPPLPSAEEILRVLQGRPLSLRQLLKALRLRAGDRTDLNRLLQMLLNQKKVARLPGGLLSVTRPEKAQGRRAAAAPVDEIIGRLAQKQADYGFVIPEQETMPDLYVAGGDLGDALPDDTVAVRLVTEVRAGRGERQRAKVVRVLKRGHTQLVGTFRKERQFGLIRPDSMPFLREFLISSEDQAGARTGEKVVAAITAWPEGYVPGRAKVVEVLGKPDQPGMDITLIVRKYELAEEFSTAAVEQAKQVAREPGAAECVGRLDLRGQRIVTIDGEDARDFDDAVSCADRSAGGWRLGVHIADVSHYLVAGTPLDLEVRERGTSVYLPDRVLHMLPEPLSCGVCSLVPDRDRLTVSAFMDIEPDGTVSHTEFFRSVIHSAGRLTYNQVEAVITPGARALAENPAAAFGPELARLNRAAQALRSERKQRGSLDFDLAEAKVILGPEGRVQAIERRQQLASHQLIEDCMVAANEAVARYLASTDTPTLYRVHDVPAGEKLRELTEFLEAYGYRLEGSSPRQASPSFQKLLNSWQGKPEARTLNMALLRAMKLAVYAPKNLGHFGLASKCYTHFTSPIRRYPDLIVHRMLCARLQGPLTGRRLGELRERMPVWGEHLSLAERKAEKAEREAVRLKQAEFMLDKLGEVFPGTITSVTNFGFFVELEEHFVEGLVRLGSLEDDYYIFQDRQRYLIGERHHREFRTGDKVTVQVRAVHPEEGQVDLVLYSDKPKPKAAHLRKGPSISKGPKRRRF